MKTTGAPRRAPRVSQLGIVSLWVLVTSAASCARSGRHPDNWFPASSNVTEARAEAAEAIEICGGCPVRDFCLDLSLRDQTLSQHGVWGGLVAAERQSLSGHFAVSPSTQLSGRRGPYL